MGFLKRFTDRVTAPEAQVQLRLTNYSVALGDNLQGALNVQVGEDFDVTEVRCEIMCVEQAKVIKQMYDPVLKTSVAKAVDETAVLYDMKPAINGPTHFIKGENKTFAVNINIPAGARASYSGIDQRVTWTIKGVLAVDDRPDRTTETNQIQVVAPTIQAAVTKEVIRTIVMIPCKYCQMLMDQTLTVCPNCGAKRTI